jgi:hypothetical protein
METWAIVVLVLGSNAIGHLATWIQVRHADKRLDKQLEREKEVYRSERRREVRSEPLLNLRAELIHMAITYEKLIEAHLKHTRFGNKNEEGISKATDDWNEYVKSREWERVLFALDDTELSNMADELRKAYIGAWGDAEYRKELNTADKKQAEEARKANTRKLAEIQSLINQRLEEL